MLMDIKNLIRHSSILIITSIVIPILGFTQTLPPAPYRVQISENKTTHLIFEQDIKYIDVGDNNNFIADYTNNMLRIRGKKNAPSTNLTVVTDDLNYYSFNVDYTATPNFNYFISTKDALRNIGLKSKEQNSTQSEIPIVALSYKQKEESIHPESSPTPSISKTKLDSKNTAVKKQVITRHTSNKKAKSMEDLERATSKKKTTKKTMTKEEMELIALKQLAQYALTDRPLFHHIKGSHGDIKLSVTGVYHSLHNCFIKYEIKNDGTVPYDIDYVEFGMREKRRPKRTALSDTIFEPIEILNGETTRVLPDRINRYVAILDKVAVPEGRILYMEVVEDGRNIPLKIPYNKIKKKFLQ